MLEGWARASIGQLAEFRSGGTPRKSEAAFWGGDIPWISGATMHESRLTDSERRVTSLGAANGTSTAPEGSTLVLVRGMSLHKEVRIGHAMRPLTFNQDIKALIPSGEILPWYLTYLLQAFEPRLLNLVHAAGHGTGVLATDQLKSIEFEIPPLDEQKRIAGVLGALDELIATNLELADRTDELRESLVGTALNDARRAVSLSLLAEFVNGKNFTKNASGSGRPVIRTPEIRRGPTEGTVFNNCDAGARENTAVAGDILFVWSGSLLVGRWLHEEGLVNQHIFKVIPKNGCPDWLVYSLIERKMPWFLGLAANQATTMGHIKRIHLDAEVPVPSDGEIARLSDRISPLWDASLKLRLEALELQHIRDELLPLLLSGKVSPRAVAG